MKKQDYEDNSDKLGEIIREKLETLDYSYKESSWEKLNNKLENNSSTYFTNINTKDIFWATTVTILLMISVYFAYENYQLKYSQKHVSFLKKYQKEDTRDFNHSIDDRQKQVKGFSKVTKIETEKYTASNSSNRNINASRTFFNLKLSSPLFDTKRSQNFLTINPLFENTNFSNKKKIAPNKIVPKAVFTDTKVNVKGEIRQKVNKETSKIYWSTGLTGGMEIDKINLAEGLFAHPNIGITQELDFANSPFRISVSALYSRKHYKFNQISSPNTDNITNTITQNLETKTNQFVDIQQINVIQSDRGTINDEGDLLVNEVTSEIVELPIEIKYFINPRLFIGAGWSSYLFMNQEFGFDPNIGTGFSVDTQEAQNKNLYSGLLMFSGGFETTLSPRLRLQMQAYYKYPLVAVGVEKANIQSFGIRSNILFRWN